MMYYSDVLYEFRTNEISNLEGKILTLLDASIGDVEQRKALKDIARQTIWDWAIQFNQIKTGSGEDTGTPVPLVAGK